MNPICSGSNNFEDYSGGCHSGSFEENSFIFYQGENSCPMEDDSFSTEEFAHSRSSSEKSRDIYLKGIENNHAALSQNVLIENNINYPILLLNKADQINYVFGNSILNIINEKEQITNSNQLDSSNLTCEKQSFSSKEKTQNFSSSSDEASSSSEEVLSSSEEALNREYITHSNRRRVDNNNSNRRVDNKKKRFKIKKDKQEDFQGIKALHARMSKEKEVTPLAKMNKSELKEFLHEDFKKEEKIEKKKLLESTNESKSKEAKIEVKNKNPFFNLESGSSSTFTFNKK